MDGIACFVKNNATLYSLFFFSFDELHIFFFFFK